MRVFLYVACVLDGECRASLTELQALGEELGSAAQVTMRWTGKLLSRAAEMWPLLPNIPKPLAELLSFGVGFVPVVGDLYDLYCGLTGYDPITGERLAGWERGLSIGAAFMPLASRHNLGITAKAPQWLDDVATLFRTGISGGTLRRIGRALPEGVVIGVRGRPVTAALWQAIYLVTGKFQPKPGIFDAEEVKWVIHGVDFTSVLEFFGLRRMQDKAGRTFLAHSDIDLQFIVENGAPVVNVTRVEEIYGDVNKTFRKPILRHGDNFSGLTWWVPNGPTLGRQNKTTIFISQSGYIGQGPGIAGFLGFLTPAWRDAVKTFLNMPEVP